MQPAGQVRVIGRHQAILTENQGAKSRRGRAGTRPGNDRRAGDIP
jgi:hypothetical protein